MGWWICVLIIFLVGLASLVAFLVWKKKFSSDKEMAQDMFELVLEWAAYVVGAMVAVVEILFGWVWEFVEELIDEVGFVALVGIVIYIAVCCFGYWAFGHYVMGYIFDISDSDWGQYFAGMTGVGLMFGMIVGFFFGICACCDMDDDYFVLFIIPFLVFGLGFLVFGVITIVIRLAG